ncbi:hypothetical protein D9611_002057 [Ephemerocybe angulata]|uniref:glutathione transferase n=1 Tax=Ephemerocybe angulata TaxID=980116 RepID=A0A8H5CHV9_9AGAR|nr:hypothetical protein D9611_002057 [Tulosesus angulatus]
MVLTLYGNSYSPCAKRVAQVLVEKQVPFKVVIIDFKKGEQKAASFVEKQPFGQVPLLDDDGYFIYESRAIARYIAEKYPDQGTPLIPKDLRARGLFEQALSIELNDFDAYISPPVHEVIFKPFLGLTPDREAFDQMVIQLEAKLDVYEKILSKQKYLAGDELTLADLFHLPYGVLLGPAGSNALDTPKRPNLSRWFKELVARPSWQAVKDEFKSMD